MGSVLEFRAPDRRCGGDDCAVADRDAEIIFFPGIRVEYQTIDLAHRPDGRGTTPGRK